MNIAAARLAKEVANAYSTPDKTRFVAGSIGPTTKLPSLGHISYDEMAKHYVEQAEALIEGGVDILLIETSQDLLQAKIALAACQDAMRSTGKKLPLQMQVTLEATGTMLLGTEIGAALAAIECLNPDIIGLNCATGPAEMNDGVRFLCQNASRPVSVLPNAGLPQNVGGRAQLCGWSRRNTNLFLKSIYGVNHPHRLAPSVLLAAESRHLQSTVLPKMP